MFGRLVDMATRTLIIDLSKGTGGEPMYGMVTVQRTRATSKGTFEVLPWETKLKLFNGKATITEAVTDGSGPLYRSAYLIRVQNGYCAPRWGFMVALPDGTTPISTGNMPKVNPITGEGIYMDAQEWNALYGTLPDRVSATESRLDVLDGLGQRGYTVDQTAGRVIKVWDYLNNREQLIYGDTGARNITSLFTGLVGGSVIIRRTAQFVEVDFQAVTLPNGSSIGFVDLGTAIPTGFRPPRFKDFNSPARTGTESSTIGSARFDANGKVYIYRYTDGEVIRVSAVWMTNEPWPTSLPGVAA